MALEMLHNEGKVEKTQVRRLGSVIFFKQLLKLYHKRLNNQQWF